MFLRRYILLSVFVLSLLSGVRAQIQPMCTASFRVTDTLLVPDLMNGHDSVRYRLEALDNGDSIRWWPGHLFTDPSATVQWVTVGCYDTLKVGLTVYYHSANLFHWQQDGFVQRHTQYNYVPSPTGGDLCQPRSITVGSYPQSYCSEMDYNTPQHCIIIRPDTLWGYGDTIQPFFPIDSANPGSYFNTLFPIIREFPFDGNHVPFYVDTIEMLDTNPNYTYVLYMTHFTASQINDTLYSVPLLFFTVNIDDSVPRFFSVGHTVPLCDTTLFYYLNLSLARPAGIGASHFITSQVYFNMFPTPRGRAVFRFYETPTPYFHTTGSYCFSRIEMSGRCAPSDSVLLTGPQCGCLLRDTVYRSVCGYQLPYLWDGVLFQGAGVDSALIRSIECDTFRVYDLSVLSDDTASRYDTIVENALPWAVYGDTLTAEGWYQFVLPGVMPECDTLLHYHLTVIDNVFDTVLRYLCPDQLPYTEWGVTTWGDTLFSLTYQGSLGQDSVVTCIVYVKQNSDTVVYDSIVESQLPWRFLDSLFSDTVSNRPFVLTNEAGCDSVVYYNLYVFWEGDHCDSLLQFPNIVTPNGDGFNDRFVIGGLVENQCYPYNSLVIVDRTGRVVFHAENISREDQFWDPAARRMPSGTYFYRFTGRGVHHATQHTGCIEVLK